jgi:peptidoglycan/LPS O-acetylase OafA/YrhL
MASGAERFATMDGVRGVAAICVMLLHVTQTRSGSLLPSGYIAVDIFFCLSGFVITHSYQAKLEAGLGAAAFTTVRLIRLYPLYLAGLALGLLEFGLASRAGGTAAIGWTALPVALNGILLLPTLRPFAIGIGVDRTDRFLFPFNGPAWSLFFELVGNALFLVFRPRGRALAATLAALAILFVIFTKIDGQPSGWGRHILWGGFPRSLFSFYAGAAICQMWRAGRIPRVPLPLAPLVLVALASMAPDSTTNFLLMALIGGPCVVLMSITNPRSALLRGSFERLGEASYPLYALHLPAFGLMKLAYDHATGAPLDQPPSLIADFVFAAFMVGACAFIGRRVDPAVRRRLTLWTARLRAPAVAAPRAVEESALGHAANVTRATPLPERSRRRARP